MTPIDRRLPSAFPRSRLGCTRPSARSSRVSSWACGRKPTATGDPGTGRPSRPGDDAAVHAPDAGGAQGRDRFARRRRHHRAAVKNRGGGGNVTKTARKRRAGSGGGGGNGLGVWSGSLRLHASSQTGNCCRLYSESRTRLSCCNAAITWGASARALSIGIVTVLFGLASAPGTRLNDARNCPSRENA